MSFEEKKYCQFRTLMHRWDCSRSYIYDLVSRGRLRLWHPDGRTNAKGVKIIVATVLDVEKAGNLE